MKTSRKRLTDLRIPSNMVINASFPYAPYTYHAEGPVGWTGYYSEVNDNNNRPFRLLSDMGAVILSDCSIYKCDRRVTPGSYSASDSSGWSGSVSGDLTSQISGMPALTSLDVTEDNIQNLFMKAYAKMKTPDVKGGEVLAELGETIRMIRSPFRAARSLIEEITSRAVSRGTGGRGAKAIADAWLEYRYGWKPIILDSQKIIKTANSLNKKLGKLVLVSRAGDAATNRDSKQWSATAVCNCGGSCSQSIQIKNNVGVLYVIKPRTPAEALASTLGLRFWDVPSTMWELTPFSFVVDWFSNVGDWIQAITPDPDILVLGNWCTTIRHTDFTRSGHIEWFNGVPPSPAWAGSFGSETIKSYMFERSCYKPTAFKPGLTGVSLSILHRADAAALSVEPILKALGRLRH